MLSSYSQKTVQSKKQQQQNQQESVMEETTQNLPPFILEDGRQKWRVKLYELGMKTTWEDRGTGYCEISYVELKDALCILVRSEKDKRIILDTRISSLINYQRQQVWADLDKRDLALSFQDVRGCDEIWDSINEVRKHMAETEKNTLENDEILNELEDTSQLDSQLQLPPIELTNLPEIEIKTNEMLKTAYGREKLRNLAVKDGLIEKLCELFSIAEDVEMKDDLIKIFNIMKNIIVLNDHSVFEFILRVQITPFICGIFEYDPEYPSKIGAHRDFIKEPKRFKKILILDDQALESKIHQTFRAQYLKDVVLARIVEESPYSVLTSIIVFNQVEILNQIGNHKSALTELFQDLRNPQCAHDRKRLILLFLQDFCSTAKNVQMANRQQFYHALASNGVLQELPPFFNDSDIHLRMVVAEILMSVIEHDPTLMRSFILAQHRHNTPSLMATLISKITEESQMYYDEGLKYQYYEMLKTLLEILPPSKEEQESVAAENGDFLHFFYNEHFNLLIQPILSLQPKYEGNGLQTLELSNTSFIIYQLICDLLCFLIRIQGPRIKFFLLRDDILKRLNNLFLIKNNTMKLYAIRVFRTIIGQKDEFYNRFIVKHNLLNAFFHALSENKSKYNLLESACLELLEFVKNEHIQSLLKYIYENYYQQLIDSKHGKQVLTKYEQILNKSSSNTKIDKNEEEYFNDLEETEEQPIQPLKEDLMEKDEQPPPVVLTPVSDPYAAVEEEEENEFMKRIHQSLHKQKQKKSSLDLKKGKLSLLKKEDSNPSRKYGLLEELGDVKNQNVLSTALKKSQQEQSTSASVTVTSTEAVKKVRLSTSSTSSSST